MKLRPHHFALLAALTLTGCGGLPNLSLPAVQERNDFKGKPLSAVTARLGIPNAQQTYNGQKIYTWRLGNAVRECVIKVVMAGDLVGTYETSGDAPVCGPYEARAN